MPGTAPTQLHAEGSTTVEGASAEKPTTAPANDGLTASSSSGTFPPSARQRKAVYDAFGNEVGYNESLPHKRHPETAAAMDRYIALANPLGVESPSHTDFTTRLESGQLPQNVTLGEAPASANAEDPNGTKSNPRSRRNSLGDGSASHGPRIATTHEHKDGFLERRHSGHDTHTRREVEKKTILERVFGHH